MRSLYEKLCSRKEKISVIGLGYVGIPIAIAFSNKLDVIGFDVNNKKIEQYKAGIDPTKEVGNKTISKSSMEFTSQEERLKDARFHIVAVPTPVRPDHTPDLTPIESASRTLGRNLRKGSIVVYESTVFPGVTEEVCVPILEQESGLKVGKDFKVGYSPERINPGDKVNRLETIVKIVSGMDQETLRIVSDVYKKIIDAGVYEASSIKVAEAAKVIENAQRDVNIAFMNELSMIFNRLDIDTREVLAAAGTKWNFLPFEPGLVGGHCIGVDPYYLTYKAEKEGYHSQIILAGRKINDGMSRYVASNIIKKIVKKEIPLKQAKVAILGFTFKENTPDSRNTKIIDIINELKEYGIDPLVVDPQVDKEEVMEEYELEIQDINAVKDMDVIVLAVGHEEFLSLDKEIIQSFYKNETSEKRILFDLKGILDKDQFLALNYDYWRL